MIYAAGFRFLLAFLLLCSSNQILAQKMYRCASSYQDLPCSGEQSGKVIGNTGAGAAAASTSGTARDPQCVQRGADALQIVWKRDSGALREQQIAELGSKSISSSRRQEELDLIESVYRKRGSAPEVRAAVEAECLAEKERYAQAAALAAAALSLQRGAPAGAVLPQSSANSQPGQSDTTGSESRRNEELAANQEAMKISRCAELNRQSENLRAQERRGGNINTMNRLNEQRNVLNTSLRNQGC